MKPEPLCLSTSVASRPKILQNNSKLAAEKNDLQRRNGGRTAAVFGKKRPQKYFV
jgi:hypothetical protein